MFDIRPARAADDLARVRELFLEYQSALEVDLCFQGFERELAGLPGSYAPPDGRLLLAWAGPEPAGCVALRRQGADAAEIKRLYVRPAFRGRGLGAALARAAMAAASEAGYAKLVLDTLPQMAEAQALYRSLGFRDIAPYYANPVPGARYLGLYLDSRIR